MIVTKDMVGKDLVLLEWDRVRGKHHKIILNPALNQKMNSDEFWLFATQRFGEV